jgi:hypothetical protein
MRIYVFITLRQLSYTSILLDIVICLKYRPTMRSGNWIHFHQHNCEGEIPFQFSFDHWIGSKEQIESCPFLLPMTETDPVSKILWTVASFQTRTSAQHNYYNKNVENQPSCDVLHSRNVWKCLKRLHAAFCASHWCDYPSFRQREYHFMCSLHEVRVRNIYMSLQVIFAFSLLYVCCILPRLSQIIFFIINGVGLSPWYCGHFWPIVQAPDDRWGWLWSNW